MQTATILYIILALLLSISVAFFQYFYKNKDKRKINSLLFFLKVTSLFLMGLLLINPVIKRNSIENSKPVLSVLIDNSSSTQFFNQQENVKEILRKIKENKELQQKFEVDYFSFGNTLKVLDSLTFNEPQTNIFTAISGVNELHKEVQGAVLLVSDGNQTIGNDYQFINSKKAIYPLVIGDTATYRDVRITQVNVNKYSYMKNKFPVETLLFYEGNEPVTTQFSIYKNGKTVFTQKVRFTSSDNVKTITTNLTSVKEGQQYYTASIQKISQEKNTHNNSKTFSVEVINEQTNLLILSSVLHPDLGALKKSIESNKQRSVDVQNVDDFKNNLNDYQLVILFNPTSSFQKIVEEIKQQKKNYFIVSGAKTDWSFLNKQELGFAKKHINQTENYGAIYNDGFTTFFQKDIGFSQFPPLLDKFGEVTFKKSHQTILYQQIAGIQTQQPLLATLNNSTDSQKSAILFGDGLWKWRAASFLQENSFKNFDLFMGNLVQYLASTKKRNRLTLTAKKLYPANATITIVAFYVDKNYKFDDRASLWLHLTNNETKETKKFPFSLFQNSYQIELENVVSGDYSYQVSVDNETIKRFGKFKITDYQVEEQFINANTQKLQKLADLSKGKLFYAHQEDTIISKLIVNENYFTTQKSTVKEQYLIEWKWVLFLVILLLSIEWFLRKYYGKI